MRRLGAVIASAVLLVAGWCSPTTADAAAPGCTAADPAPQVLGITATNVVVRRELVRIPGPQSVQVVVRNACGGGYEFQGCSFDPPQPCTQVDVRMRRTSAATSPSARSCGRNIETFDNAGGKPTPSGFDPDLYLVDLGERWEVHDDGDGLQPLIRNACAGAWDVTAVASNTWQDGSSTGAPFTRPRAFSLLRWSHLTADAGPEPVRAGGLVTVRGRLVRADWNVDRNVAYAGQPVQLQRRTATGVYRTLRTVRTVRADRDGRLQTRLRALSTERCYRWAFGGSSTTASAVSSGDCVRVRS